MKDYFIYITSSPSGTLYVGMTNDLNRRIAEHRMHAVPGFTKKYGCDRLVYFEVGNDVMAVIEREKQIKRWSRTKKVI
ncbi:MAG: GIY-YIG nuclease family protein [Patescibacteria group bacterium]